MALTNRGSISELLSPELHDVVVSVGKARPREYVGIINTGPMPWNPMTDQQMHGLGPTQAVGENDPYPLEQIYMGGRVTYTADAFAMALEFSREAWRDELYGALRTMVGEMAASWVHRENVTAFAVLNDAFAGATYTGFDGAPLVSTSHTGDPDGVTKSNRPSPDVTLSQTGIQNAILTFENIRTGRNMPRILSPSMFTLPPVYRFTARELLGSSGKPVSADNDLNALIADDLSWRIVHYLTQQCWFLHVAPADHNVYFYTRDGMEEDSFDNPMTRSSVFAIWGRLSTGFGEYRGWYGSLA